MVVLPRLFPLGPVHIQSQVNYNELELSSSQLARISTAEFVSELISCEGIFFFFFFFNIEVLMYVNHTSLRI